MACRLCLSVFDQNLEYVSLDNMEHGFSNDYFLILKLLPQLNLELTTLPRICLKCSSTLHTIEDFKLQYLETENKIRTYKDIFSTRAVDMTQLASHRQSMAIEKSESEICRICLFYFSKHEKCLSLQNSIQYVEEFFPEMNMDTSTPLLICERCTDIIAKMHEFQQKCLKVEAVLNQSVSQETCGKFDENYLINIAKCSEYYLKENCQVDEKQIGLEDVDVCESKPVILIKEEEMGSPEDVGVIENFKEEICNQSVLNTDDNLMQEDSKKIEDNQIYFHVKEEFPEDLLINPFELSRNTDTSQTTDTPCSNPIIQNDKQDFAQDFHYNLPSCRSSQSSDPTLPKHVGMVELKIDEINVPKELQKSKKTNKKFLCSMCDVSYRVKSNLMLHVRNIHDATVEVPMFYCSLCTYQTVRKITLKKHIARFHCEKTMLHKCNICKYQTYNEFNLKQHIYCRHKKQLKRKYYCTYCSFETFYTDSLKKHERVQHLKKDSHKCSVCGFETFYKNHLRSHIDNKHRKDTVYKCSLCEYETFSKITHKSHVKFKHLNPEVDVKKCSECDFTTRSKKSLSDHQKRKHFKGIVKIFKCMKCDYETGLKLSLTEHIQRKHTEMCEIAKCPLCNYKTFVQRDLAVHIRRQHKKKKQQQFVHVKVEQNVE